MNVYFNQSGVVGVGDVDNEGATTPHNTVWAIRLSLDSNYHFFFETMIPLQHILLQMQLL